MTIATIEAPAGSSGWIARSLGLLYGAVAYAVFLGTFLYAIGFTGRFIAPKTINSGGTLPPLYAVAVNLALLALFAIQQSGMARKGFKRVLTRYVPPAVERSTYVLCTSLALIVLFVFWQPIRTVVWHIDDLAIAFVVLLLSMAGWLMVHQTTMCTIALISLESWCRWSQEGTAMGGGVRDAAAASISVP